MLKGFIRGDCFYNYAEHESPNYSVNVTILFFLKKDEVSENTSFIGKYPSPIFFRVWVILRSDDSTHFSL